MLNKILKSNKKRRTQYGYSIFETPPPFPALLRQIQEKQLNRHFEPSFDFREGFSDAATVGSGIMDVGRGSCFTLVGRTCDVECVVVENVGSGSMEAVGG
ncbi:hypothetical protein ES332_A05G072900v1 [Gossypium tomentosum]|uniref:Uncharacterized protein n=1 Tax=Gossypium tomentosum TaxID=34277 RepID=A0A5D2QBC1_GOSTO|nr:hypothetical protein ES332_A05G072900v1 [Gossypium tomentosum]